MAGSRVLIPRVRRLATLVVIAAIATALAGVTPATAGGKPTPLAPSQRSAATANRQVAEALAAMKITIYGWSISLDPPKHRELDGIAAGQRAI